VARPLFTLVVCDTPPAQDHPARFAALRAADRVYLVVDQADPSAVRTAGEVYLLEKELGADLSRFALVANHHRPELGGVRELEGYYRQGGVDCPVLACVPHDAARHGAARRRGRPAACDLDLESAEGAPWRTLSHDALGLDGLPAAAGARGRRGLLGRIFARGGGRDGRA
jgi:Flp pilus assembly CpaE family ATPase